MNEAGLSILMKFEQGPKGGPALEAYQDIGGVWTIGYGHTNGVVKGMVCTVGQAEDWLAADCVNAENDIDLHCGHADLNENQISALECLVFNIGRYNFDASTLLRDINSARLEDVPFQFMRWNHVRGAVVEGLTRRRQAEVNLWNAPVEQVS